MFWRLILTFVFFFVSYLGFAVLSTCLVKANHYLGFCGLLYSTDAVGNLSSDCLNF
jgi:hypothetical protein